MNEMFELPMHPIKEVDSTKLTMTISVGTLGRVFSAISFINIPKEFWRSFLRLLTLVAQLILSLDQLENISIVMR